MPFYLPFGKARIPHLLACHAVALAKADQGFAVKDYSFTLGALELPDERDLSRGILDFCNVRVTIVHKGRKAAFHRPHPGKDALRYRVNAARDFLKLIGVTP